MLVCKCVLFHAISNPTNLHWPKRHNTQSAQMLCFRIGTMHWSTKLQNCTEDQESKKPKNQDSMLLRWCSQQRWWATNPSLRESTKRSAFVHFQLHGIRWSCRSSITSAILLQKPSRHRPGAPPMVLASTGARDCPRVGRLCEMFLLRRRMNIELNFRPNFEGLVLGCIDADYASEYSLELGYIGKLSPRSTQCTPLHRSSISKCQPKIANIFSRLNIEFLNFCHFSRQILHFSENFL